MNSEEKEWDSQKEKCRIRKSSAANKKEIKGLKWQEMVRLGEMNELNEGKKSKL